MSEAESFSAEDVRDCSVCGELGEDRIDAEMCEFCDTFAHTECMSKEGWKMITEDDVAPSWSCPSCFDESNAESFSAEDKCYICGTTKGTLYYAGKKGMLCHYCSEGGVKYRAESFSADDEVEAGKYRITWKDGKKGVTFDFEGGDGYQFDDEWTDLFWDASNPQVEEEKEAEDFASVVIAPVNPKGPVEKAVMNHYLIVEGLLQHALLTLDNEVQLGIISEREAERKLRKIFEEVSRLREFRSESFSAEVTEEEYDDWLDELGESAISNYDVSWLFKRADEIAYNMGLQEYVDEMEEECHPTPPDFEPCYTEREMEDIYDEMLDDSLGTDWLADNYSISWLLKRGDPTAYRVGFNDYEDMMTEDNEAETFAAHEPNCDCYGCEDKRWKARPYWKKQILLDNPNERPNKGGYEDEINTTRKCAKCAKYGVDSYGAKVYRYNDGLRIFEYDKVDEGPQGHWSCECSVYDHSIRNSRTKKVRRIQYQQREEERQKEVREREEVERPQKPAKKWWQVWRAEDYGAESQTFNSVNDPTYGLQKRNPWSWGVQPENVFSRMSKLPEPTVRMILCVKCERVEFEDELNKKGWCRNCVRKSIMREKKVRNIYRIGGKEWVDYVDGSIEIVKGAEYNFVMSDVGEADDKIEEKMNSGWQLYGNPILFDKHDHTLLGQGMTKKAENQVRFSKPIGFYVGTIVGLGGFLALRSYFRRYN